MSPLLTLALVEGEASPVEAEVLRMIDRSEAPEFIVPAWRCRMPSGCVCRADVPHGCANWVRA